MAIKEPPGSPEVLDRVFPELELVVEAEDTEGQEEEGRRLLEQLKLQEGQQGAAGAQQADPAADPADVTEQEIDEIEGLTSAERQQFAHFQAVLQGEPGQVLRYCFEAGAQPLWPSTLNLPRPADIPCCERCGAPRRFEFQVLPTLINSLETDPEDPESIDFGSIAVYTCSASCSPPEGEGPLTGPDGKVVSRAYAEEFCWALPG